MPRDKRSLSRRIRDSRRDLKELLSRVNAVTRDLPSSRSAPVVSGDGEKAKDLIISSNELNLHHGTGVLMNRIFPNRTSYNLRSRDDYPDKGSFVSRVVMAKDCSRSQTFAMVLEALAGKTIRRIICVPYYPEDYLVAIACKAILGVPLVAWIMDDSILHGDGVDPELVTEFFDVADIRFVISPEMRDAYEGRFELKFHVLPPTVDNDVLATVPAPDDAEFIKSKTCAMVGNIWSMTWFKDFLGMVRESGWTVHWFGRGSACAWLETTPEELRKHGIIEMGFIPENELPQRLAKYPFSILPTGTCGEDDDRKNVTMLSLPTRVAFLIAAARVPMLVVGSRESCSSRTIERFGVGLSIPYDAQQFKDSCAKLADPEFNKQCRDKCAAIAPGFSDTDLANWIWKSGELKTPADQRFETMFKREPGVMIPFIDDPAAKDLGGDSVLVYLTMRRIARMGYKPDFVIDVGASSGIWSGTLHRLFPAARYILIEPLPDRYDQWFHENHTEFEWVAAAASNEDGNATFQISNDLYGSSLLTPQDNRSYHSVEVPVVTLDTVMTDKAVTGRGVVKIDVQFAEHLVIEGAQKLLANVDFLIVELTLLRQVPEARTFLEMVNQLEEIGFKYFDDIGGWRCPMTGILEQKDVVFINTKIAGQYQGKEQSTS